MASATDVDADKQECAWIHDDTGKRSVGTHMGYRENTSCRSVYAWEPGVLLRVLSEN